MFCIYVDMYMYMYSDLPHVHGADWRGVRGCAATVLRPRTIIFCISHVMYMGVGAGVGTLVMRECMPNAVLNQLQKCPGKVLDVFATFLYEPWIKMSVASQTELEAEHTAWTLTFIGIFLVFMG